MGFDFLRTPVSSIYISRGVSLQPPPTYFFNTYSWTYRKTSSATPVDDAVSLSITLAFTTKVVIIYNGTGVRGIDPDYNAVTGLRALISINGVDKPESQADICPYRDAANLGHDAFTSIWVGVLSPGSYTIKGRFASNVVGNEVHIDRRVLLLLGVPSEGYAATIEGVMSTVQVQISDSTLVDDSEASYTISLVEEMEVIILYQASSKYQSAEGIAGKYGTINIDGTDYSVAKHAQSCRDGLGSADRANSFTILYSLRLSAGQHVIKGRFASNVFGQTVSIDQRQLVIIAIPGAFKIFRRESAIRVQYTAGGGHDTEAHLSFNLTESCKMLVIYNPSSNHGSVETIYGKLMWVYIDGSFKEETRSQQNPYAANYANGGTSVWVGTLAAGAHTVDGDFGTVGFPGETCGVDQRVILALAVPTTYIQ